MSEKQFTTKNIICSNYCVWDNNDKHYGNDELVIFLNEQLSIIRRNELSMKTMMSNMEKLEKENEKLKIANTRWLDKSLQDKQIRYSNTNNKELTVKYLQLKEENEQLKSENKKLRCINDQLEERLENSGIGIVLKMDCDMNE